MVSEELTDQAGLQTEAVNNDENKEMGRLSKAIMGSGADTEDIYSSSTFDNQLSLRVDEGVGAMSISPSYRDVVLASRSGLFIVDLDDPFSQPRYLPHRTSWEVADVQWSPHASKPNWVISTSNQKAIVWNLALASERAVEYVLHGHKRAITDINFSQDPEILATCSVDSFVHIWDLRDPRKPSVSFADWYSAATQVKFNRQNSNIIGSTHDRTLYIWDKRKGSIPLHKFDAHKERINCLDFNRIHETKLLTSSNDFTVKIWDYSKSDTEPEAVIETNFPVWRARHTPFGDGCMIMPMRGGDNSVFLHNLKDLPKHSVMNPTHAFQGHTQPVKEFLWRARGGNSLLEDRDFQLVTWSKDNDLRLWPVNSQTLESVHYKKGQPIDQKLSRRGAKYETYRKEPPSEGFWQGIARRPSKANSFGSMGANPFRRESVFMTSARPAVQNLYAGTKQETSKDQLDWISGVRIGKSAFDRFNGMTGAVSSAFETPGNLGEEVSIVGHKFPKIRLEKISVATGELVISLNGPWGEDEELIFIRADFKFPQDYPNSPPEIDLEKYGSISAETREKIIENVVEISQILASRGRYCLEMCLRYLLGEEITAADVEKQLDEIANSLEAIDDVFDDDDEAVFVSSDEEDREDVGSIDDEDADDDFDDDLIGVGGEATTVKNNTDNTPLPKQCGAVWSRTGKLVCFFPNKRDKFKGPLSTIQVAAEFDDDNDDQPLENDSDDSFISESDDDFGAPSKWMGPAGVALFNTSAAKNLYNFRKRDREGSGKILSLTERSQGTQNTSDLRAKNVLHILDFRYMLPARRELAAEYQVLGKPPEELARINAEVAEKYECFEIADTWKLLELLLTKNVILVDGFLTIQANNQLTERSAVGEIVGKYNWGLHPFGHSWLIKELFNYYERANNVQMLAMMSCVLTKYAVSEKMTQTPLNRSRRSGRFEINGAELKHASIQFIPNDALANESHAATNTTPLKSPFPHDLLCRENSTGYFENILQNNLFTSAATSPLDIPGRLTGLNTAEHSGDISAASSAKGDARLITAFYYSPDKQALSRPTLSRRTTGGGLLPGSGLASQLNSGDNSPRDTRSGEMSFSSFSVNRASKLTKRSDNENNQRLAHQASQTSFYSSSDAGNIGMDLAALAAPKVNLEILDSDAMDNFENTTQENTTEDYYMGPEMKDACFSYRTHYSAMLYNWGLEVESLEILKFNFGTDNGKKLHPVKGPNQIDGLCSPLFGFDNSNHNYSAADSELIMTPASVKERSFARICQFCDVIIRSRFFQCRKCEHVVHAACGEAWWRSSRANECPTGCGCNCMAFIMPT